MRGLLLIEHYGAIYVDRDQRPCFVYRGELIFEVWRFLDGAWLVVGHDISEATRSMGVAVLEPGTDVSDLVDSVMRELN